MIPLFAPYPDVEFLRMQNQMEDYYDSKLKDVERKGDNPQIFQYAFYQDSINNILVLQMWFYEGCKVISFFR